MSKFRYYITDLFKGEVVGTNSKDLAAECAACEDFYVVDSETAEWLYFNSDHEDGFSREPIQERLPYTPPPESAT